MMSAPRLDGLLRHYDISTLNPQMYDSKVKEKINELYEMLDKIKPIDEDDLIILYFLVDRGSIEDYGDYEELKYDGEVSSYEEFERYYKEDYPEDVYWYRMVTSKYKNYRSITVNFKNIIYADMDSKDECFENEMLQELMDFLIIKVKECIKRLENNTYNDYVEKNLFYKNRFGVIKRSDYWKVYPDAKKNLLEVLSLEEIDDFINNACDIAKGRIEKMTSGKYFECVRLVYQNIGYEINDLTDRDLYLKYADGRDEGLSKLDLNSWSEFDKWYNDRTRFGGHPWEIIRGHSFARVNLQVGHDEKGYYLFVDGSTILRKVEIVKIFLIFYKNNIPLEISSVDTIKNALKGEDYIGIVPRGIFPIMCESYFKKYNPKEFVNIDDEKLLNYIIWQDIEKMYLK